MDGVKNFLTSKTIWGAVLALAAAGAGLAGFDIGDAEGWVADLVAMFGAGFAIYGRVKAVKRIG